MRPTEREIRWTQGRKRAEEHIALDTKFSAFLWGCVLLMMAGIVAWAWWTGR